MVLKNSTAPYQRRKKTTFQIMMELTIALTIVWIAAIITTFVKNPTYTQTVDGVIIVKGGFGVNSILLMVVSLATTFCCDALVTILRNKKDKELFKKIPNEFIHSYSWITSMIFTLSMPVWSRYYVIIIGSIFATLIGKYVFGGFGKNIFNPAAMGRIFVILTFSLAVPKTFIAGPSSAAEAGSTITSIIGGTSYNWLSDAAIKGYSVIDILSGNYFAAMGETFTILLFVLGVILAIRKDIDWRTPVFYLGTMTVCSLIISLTLGHSNPGRYLVYQLGTGGAMFAAVFMFTDPVTTPTSQFGKCLIGVIAGLLTIMIRIGTDSVEGVIYTIAIVNLITPMINGLVVGKTNSKLPLKYGITFGLVAVSIGLSAGISYKKYQEKKASNTNDIKEVVKVNNSNIIDVNNYVVTIKGGN